MKKKLLFVLKDMNIGGVEKAFLSLVNELSPERYDIDLLLLERKGGFLNHIPTWVNVFVLDEYAMIKELVNCPPLVAIKEYIRAKQYNRWIVLMLAYMKAKATKNWSYYYKVVFDVVPENAIKYDVAIAFSSIISYVSWYVVYKVNAKKKFGWIHFDISKVGYDRALLTSLHEQMDTIFAVSKEAHDVFAGHFPILESKCKVLHNVVSHDMICDMAAEEIVSLGGNGLKIMTLGRLSSEKGQDLIPEVVVKLMKLKIPFTWYLIGDGKLRLEIEEQIRRLEIENELVILGTKANPYPILKQCDVYVQTSRHEGYCISLAEARALHLPIVTTDFTGAREQLADSGSGTIVDCSVDALAGAIAELMENTEKRMQYARLLQGRDATINEMDHFDKAIML